MIEDAEQQASMQYSEKAKNGEKACAGCEYVDISRKIVTYLLPGSFVSAVDNRTRPSSPLQRCMSLEFGSTEHGPFKGGTQVLTWIRRLSLVCSGFLV